MKNMGKRILALFLILALAGPFLPGDLGGLFGIKAYAQDGSEANPYLIYTTADFITHLRTGTAPTIPVHYKQMADIDLRPTWDPGAVTSTNMQLSPNCVYDGNGFTINVTLPGAERTAAEISTYDYTYYHGGVFRLVYGTVKNTHVYINNLSYDITHTGNNNTLSMGGIAGMVSGGQILNSSVTGSLTIQMDGTGDRLGLFTGGVAGEALTRTRIDGCYINMNLTAYGNSNVRHAIYAGSVAGRVMFSGNANEGAKITNNLIESTTVELQNGRAFTWQYAPAFAGGIAGWIDQQTFGGTTRDGEVRGNVLRSTRARSYMGSGSAGGGSNKQGMALALCPRITISMAPIYANAPRGIHSNYLDGELSATAQHTWSGIGNFATSAPYATSRTRDIHGITYQDINSVPSTLGEVAPVVILNNVGLSAAALNTNNSAGQSVWASGAVNAASGELIRVGGLTAAAVYPEWMFFNVPTVTEKVETAACVCEPVDDPARNCGCYVITTPAQDYVPANPGVVSGTCPGDSATPTDGPCTFTVANPSCSASGCNKELVGKTDEIEAKDAVWTKSSCGDCQLAQKTWVFTFSPPKSPAGGEKDMNARNIFFEITYTNQAGTEKTERVVSTATGGTSFTVGSINVVTNEATRIVRLGEEPQGNSVITVRTWAGGRIGEAPFYVATDEKYFFPVSSGEWSRPPLITTVSTAGIDQGIRITRNRTDNTSESINYQVVAEGGSFYGVPPNMWQARLISGTTTLGQGESITIPYSQIRGSWSSLRVTAHATVVSDPPDDTIPQSGLAEVIFDSRQKPVAPAPNAIIGRTGSPPSQNDYYAPGDDRLIIERPATVESTPNVTQELHPTAGILRYTLNGSVPSAVNGFDYPSDGVLLPVNQPSVIINAALIRENYPPSETASFTVNMRVPYGQPIFSIGNDSGIHVGQPLSMLIDERDLPDALMPSYYRRVGDSTATPTNYTFQEVLDAPGNYYGVIVVRNGTNAKSGASFTSYNDYASSLPQVEVSFGTASVSRMYAPPQPEIRFENSSGEVTSTQPHVWRTLTLTGAAGESVSVFAQMRTNNPTVRLDGLPPAHPVTFNFHPPVQNVTAAPLTSADNVIAVALNTPIILSSATPPEGSNEVSIFYSLSGTPSVNYDSATGVYTPNFGTHIYNRQTGIPVTGTPGSFFTIFAGAVRSDMSPSGISEYTYRISALDAVAAPVASPHTSLENITTVENNSRVVLTSGTSGARIFYSFTGMPQVSFNSDTGQYVYDNVHTLSYDNVRNTGIQLSGTPGSVASIHAVALRENMSDSSVVTFTYRIAALPMSVLASPAEGTVVSDTEVTLSTSTPDAIIFYEIGRRESDTANPTVNVSQVYRAPIKISANTYIKAVAFKDGVSSTVTSFDYRLANQVGRPEPSIPSGSVVARGTLLKLDSGTSGASVTYTIDGSDPTNPENNKRMHGSDIAISAAEGTSVSISAFAHRTGMTPSEVISISYTVSTAENVLSANPPPDTVVRPGDRITLSTSITGAEIHYTTDGSEPTRHSPKGSTIVVDGIYGEAFSIRAVAAADTMVTVPHIFSYRMIPRTPPPSASIPNGAIILEGATVTLTAPEGIIYFTTDGSEPTASSQMYTDRFRLAGSTVLKAIAAGENKAPSEVMEYIYTMAGQVAAPTASRPSGMIEVGSRIELTTATEGATIHYTTNGMTPTADNLRDSFIYEGPITVSRPVTIRMIAVMHGMNPSVGNTVTYTLSYPVEEEAADSEAVNFRRGSDRLFLFDQFADIADGPSFEDIVLRDSQSLVVVSAAQGALPDGVQLVVVRERNPSAEDENAVVRSLEMMRMASLYHVVLNDSSGNPAQPMMNDKVEIGLPIPEGYQDRIILICRINENGTVTAFPTRRSDGMVYAVVDHFSKYAVAVPDVPENPRPWQAIWGLWPWAAGILALCLAVLTLAVKKRKAADNY